MSKKNSNVILKDSFKENETIIKTYLNFKKNLKKLKLKSAVIAISGGPDSLALAALSKHYSLEFKMNFFYVLINHNLRKNSKHEAAQVKKLLKKHNIDLVVLNNKKLISKNIQGEARKIRYNMLLNFSKKYNVKTILTAHNLEDQVETFFIRLSRGSGLTGLSGMKKLSNLDNKVKLFRPFLDTKKASLIKISSKVFGKYFFDPSNKNNKYLRTKIRNLKNPLLKSGISYDQIIRSINNLASSKEILDKHTKDISKNLIKKSKSEIFIDLKKFIKLNLEIKLKIINESIKKLKKNYYNPRSKKVINLIKNIESRKEHKSTLGGCLFIVKKDQLRLKREKL